jgi:hypothetical protein
MVSRFPARMAGRAVRFVLAGCVASCTLCVPSAFATSIFTIAGSSGSACHGSSWKARLPHRLAVPATTAAGLCPEQVAALPGGDLVYTAHGRLMRIDSRGFVHHFAGAGPDAPTGDGGPATAAGLAPSYLAVEASGAVLVSDALRVRRIAPNGTIETVAGNGQNYDESSGVIANGAPATSGPLAPTWIATTADGGFLVIEARVTGLIRKVAPDGTISTVAGRLGPTVYEDARPTYPDGTPALEVPLTSERIAGLAALPDGSFAIAAGAIQVVGPDGRYRSLPGFLPEPKSAADPVGPSAWAVAPSPGGDLVVSWISNSNTRPSISRLDSFGVLNHVAGKGDARPTFDFVGLGDGRPAERAAISPHFGGGLTVTPDGSVVFVEQAGTNGGAYAPGSRLRMVAELPARRLAAEMLPWTLASLKRVTVSFVLSAPARVEVVATRRGRTVSSAATDALTGKGTLTLPDRLPNGQNVITLTATGAAGETAVDRLAMLPNGWLPARWARRAISSEDSPGGSGTTPVGNAAAVGHARDTYVDSYITRCRRFTPRRVDCLRLTTYSPGDESLWTAFTVRLGHNGRVYVRSYAPAGTKRRPKFLRAPRWRPRELQTLTTLDK